MTLSSYATTVYSPANLQPQPPAKSRSGFKRMSGQRLSWGKIQMVKQWLSTSPYLHGQVAKPNDTLEN